MPTNASVTDAVLGTADLQILSALASGASVAETAKALYLADRTVRRRLYDICDRLQVETNVEAVVWAVRRRLI